MIINAKRVGLISGYVINEDCFIKKGVVYKFSDIDKVKYDFIKPSSILNGGFTISINGKDINFGIHRLQRNEIMPIIDKLIEDISSKNNAKINNDERMNQLVKKQEEIEKRKSYFESIKKELPIHKINLSRAANRNILMLLDEIKVTPITKKFNKDSLIKYIVISINTTGLKAANDDIIELSAIKYVDYEPVEVFNTYVSPRKEIDIERCQNNKFEYEKIISSPKIRNIIPDFDDFAKGFNLVAYNIPFVLKFLYVNGSNLLEQNNIKKYDVSQIYMRAIEENELDKLNDAFYDFNKFVLGYDTISKCLMTEDVFVKSIDLIINNIN